MFERLSQIEADYVALEESLGTSEVLNDQNKLREASRRYKQQTPLIQCIREYKEVEGNAEAARELMADAKGAEREQLQNELEASQARIAELEEKLKVLLLPPDPNDGNGGPRPGENGLLVDVLGGVPKRGRTGPFFEAGGATSPPVMRTPL